MSVYKTARAFYPLLHWMTKAYWYKAQNLWSFPPPVRNHHMTNWAKDTITQLNLKMSVSGAAPAPSGALLVGNHVSYLDIPFLMAATPCVFVAKAEIAKWPLVAQGCNLIGVVYVHRDPSKKRNAKYQVIADKVLAGDNVVIFPSGTTTLDENVPWKDGAFRIAKAFDLPIQPFRLRYEPMRLAAYIDDDVLVTSVYKVLANHEPILAHIEFGEVRKVSDIETTKEEIKAWCQEILPTKTT